LLAKKRPGNTCRHLVATRSRSRGCACNPSSKGKNSSSSTPGGAVREAVPSAHLINTAASARCTHAASPPSRDNGFPPPSQTVENGCSAPSAFSHRAEALVITHILPPVISAPLPGARHNFSRASTRETLRARLRRQRRHSYQPRATPWAYRPKTLLSAESAIHCAQALRRVPTPRRDLGWSNPKNSLRQAVGLQRNKTGSSGKFLSGVMKAKESQG
jgi:hypothetical protein